MTQITHKLHTSVSSHLVRHATVSSVYSMSPRTASIRTTRVLNSDRLFADGRIGWIRSQTKRFVQKKRRRKITKGYRRKLLTFDEIETIFECTHVNVPNPNECLTVAQSRGKFMATAVLRTVDEIVFTIICRYIRNNWIFYIYQNKSTNDLSPFIAVC